MKFYLGTHRPYWLRQTDVPLFVSDRTLRRYRNLPVAKGEWSLDSGGFTELSTHGSWDEGPSPAAYVARVRRYRDEVGGLVFAAPQDWMCEPFITAKTSLTVLEHQRRTVANLLELRSLAADLPIVPVLQGWSLSDYLRCVDLYDAAGIDLTAEAVVGVGSVCRRQHTQDIADVFTALHRQGLRSLHGFGVKINGLAQYGRLLASSDSMAWSAGARREPPLPECVGHAHCQNCFRYAMRWRDRVLHTIERTRG